MHTSFLKIERLTKRYPGAPEPVFEDVNFAIERGEFVCIIGHSGCGTATCSWMSARCRGRAFSVVWSSRAMR